MEEEHLKLLAKMTTLSSMIWARLGDIAKRCKLSEGEWKAREHISAEWKAGYKEMLNVKKHTDAAAKAMDKICTITKLPEAKLEKMGIDAIVKDFKMHDKVVDKADESIGRYLIWLRKFEKELTLEVKMLPNSNALTRLSKEYMKNRSQFNKELQAFQRLAKA